jgi:Type I restriction enzyme R protein N terminus (HSDR_N)
MARPSKAAKSEAVTAAEDNGASIDEIDAIEDGKIFDYITGKLVAENDKERVRQRIARALFHEYGISVDDMEPDFKVKVDGSNKKIDIAIFEPGSEHTPENVRRLVVCQKELKLGDKGAYKMRDHEQAAKDLDVLKAAMAACENCKYGLWTNGLEFFFFRVERTRFDVKFKPMGDWPLSDESIATRDVASHAGLRRADPEMLRTAFRRCHNFIHGNCTRGNASCGGDTIDFVERGRCAVSGVYSTSPPRRAPTRLREPAGADPAHAEVRHREAARETGVLRRRVQGHRHVGRRLARDEAGAARPRLDRRPAQKRVQDAPSDPRASERR